MRKLVAATALVAVGGLGLWLMTIRDDSDHHERPRHDDSPDHRPRSLVDRAARTAAPKLITNENELLQKDCDQGNIEACRTLGRKLWVGWKEPVDARRALGLFISGCQKEHAESCGDAGGLLYQGLAPVSRDHRAALVYLDKACTMGVALACSRAQDIFEQGDVPKDPVRAEHYHAKALALGLDDP